MRLRLGRPRRALILAPHPDDEVIGAGLLIRALRRSGCRVGVVIVTDGAASHAGSMAWPKRRLVAERRRESRRALRRLGVDGRAVTFLALADGALAKTEARCRRAIHRELMRRRGVDLVVGPACEDEHPDHRAVAAAIATAPSPARRLAYRVWPARCACQVRSRRWTGSAGAMTKRSLIGVYRTQLGGVRDDPSGFAISRRELVGFAHPVERFSEARR